MREFWETYKPYILKELACVVFGLWVASALYCHFTGLPLSQSFPWVGFKSFFNPYITEGQMVIIWGVAAVTVMAMNTLFFYDPRRGQSRFANDSDLRKAGYKAGKGIVLGKVRGKFIWSDEDSHILVAAMSRSGKGVSLVTPNLLNWAQSAFVLDVKGENHENTSGFRAKNGQRIIRIAPEDKDGRTDSFNPFDRVKFDSDAMMSDLDELAQLLFPDDSAKDEVWPKEARALFRGVAAYLYLEEGEVTMYRIYEFLNSGKFARHVRTIIDQNPDLPPEVMFAYNMFGEKSDKEQSGVLTTMNTVFSAWSIAGTRKVTSSSTFSFKELRDRNTTFYLCIPFEKLKSYQGLIKLLIQAAISDLTAEPFEKGKHKEVLFLLDEFCSAGRLGMIDDRVTDLAGYGIRLFCIFQDLAQLNKVYGDDNAKVIVNNFRYSVHFRVKCQDTLRWLSSMMGEKRVKKRTKSYKAGGGVLDAPTISESYENVPLMTPSQIQLMPDTELLIMKAGHYPVKAKKIIYYKDKQLKNCILPPVYPPVAS